MLEFDSEHKSFNGSLKSKKGVKVRNISISGLLIASIILFSGCSKDVDCNISDFHAHYYVNENSFNTFIIGEKENVNGWKRTEEYIIIDREEEKLINFENENGLFKISYNQDKIDEIVSSQGTSYTEYRYTYRWLQLIPTRIGKITTFSQIWHTAYSWTTDSERSDLTGEQREVTKVYYGYKVIKDEKGNLQLVQSEMVDNLTDLSADYIYIQSNFYKTVYIDNKNSEVDYEDGPEEEKPNYDTQEYYEDSKELRENLNTKLLRKDEEKTY